MKYSTVAPAQTGDINLQGTSGLFPWNVAIHNNVVRENKDNPIAGVTVYGVMTQGTSTITLGGSGLQNVFKGLATMCGGAYCDTGDNITTFGTSASPGNKLLC